MRSLTNDGAATVAPKPQTDQATFYSSSFVVGSRGDQYGAFKGELSEVLLAPGQYVDVSQTSIRSMFSSGGTPIALDFDAILGSGIRPLLYLNRPFDSFQTNSGTGGDLLLLGTLTQGTPPQ